jgi:phospho-N-acetylmuramoyl-pentapeptide-transferase
VGFRDDYLKVVRKNPAGISSWAKISWQTVTTALALTALLLHPASSEKIRELWVPFVKHPIIASMPIALLVIFVYFWIVGFSNAINLTDGLDGLAIGCTITVALTYGIFAYAAGNAKMADYLLISFVPGTGELAVVCGALVGAGVAFLWYNSYPAELFMVQQPLTLVIVGGVFVWEALSVVIQVGVFKLTRRREGQGRRFFLMAPIHHHFQKLGWPETKVVLRFWILSLIFALAGLGTLKIR